MIGKTITHYEILEPLGKGGMGIVFKALDTRLQRIVAIKMLPAEFAADEKSRRRLMAEARAASALNHPHICTIYEIDETNGSLFIAMEYVDGHTLSEEISSGPIEIGRALDLATQIAEALQRAHGQKIIHRDIKPNNILVTDDGNVKILDFGLAHVLKEAEEELLSKAITREESLTETGKIVGTIHYMSPEQIGGTNVDARADIFSFGVVLYQILTGTLPFQGDSVFEIMSSILKNKPPSLSKYNSKVPAAIEKIVAKALAKDRDERYGSMKELIEDLKKMKEEPAQHDRKQSLAVLYFENLSGEKEEEYFRDGMTEDIITELSKIRDLRVFPRSAVAEYRDNPLTVPQIGKQLDAAYVLCGSLRRAGNHVRITTQLVQADAGHSVWAERYDREMKDVFELQDDIARNIAQALRIALSPQEEKAIARKPTENPEAYDYYLRGRGYTRRATYEDLEYALQMFEHAVLLQPDFALAYAGIANACSLLYHWYGEEEHWIEKALSAAERALDVDPELPEALAARAENFVSQHQYEDAIEYALRAIKYKPACERAYWTLGRAYFVMDRWQEALDIAPRAIEYSGDDYNVYIPFIHSAERLGKEELARQFRKRHIHLVRRQLEMVPEDVRGRMLLANNYASEGLKEEAIRELKKAIALRPHDTSILYNGACTFGILQMRKEALETLEKAASAGFTYYEWVERDPDLNCIRDDPQFHQILEQVRKKTEEGRNKR
ncbi:protein kinase [bacterium]|nr:protein kinase [bacterium]MCI0605485.1 protein kinase [bacterium]